MFLRNVLGRCKRAEEAQCPSEVTGKCWTPKISCRSYLKNPFPQNLLLLHLISLKCVVLRFCSSNRSDLIMEAAEKNVGFPQALIRLVCFRSLGLAGMGNVSGKEQPRCPPLLLPALDSAGLPSHRRE